jgi:hypothetical protein
MELNWLLCPLLRHNRLLVRSTTRAAVNAGKRGRRDAEKIKCRDQPIGKCQACASNRLIPAWAHSNSLVAMNNVTVTAKSAKKFHIFHERHFRKPANIDIHSSPAEDSMIAASHSEQDARIMRESVRQPINQASGQANPKITAADSRILHCPVNLFQTSPRYFGVRVHKPKNVTASRGRAGIHLCCPTALTADKAIAKPGREPVRAVCASTIGYYDFSAARSLAQMRQKWA